MFGRKGRFLSFVFISLPLFVITTGCTNQDNDMGQMKAQSNNPQPTQVFAGGEKVDIGNSEASKLYVSACASCHGANLEGGVAPGLQKIGGKYTKEDILDSIKYGRGPMAPHLLNDEDAEKVAAFLVQFK
ncbi:MAG TPA: cytochrome c [Bacillota bacterium]|nr:cytochrome c [Bacillota bacterium]